MPNKTYDNFFLANEIEDQYNSHLDLVQFCTVDNSLTGTAGMDYKVHVYKATDGTVKGLADEVKKLAENEETAFLFEKAAAGGFKGAKPAEKGDPPGINGMTLERLRGMNATERHTYSLNHPEEYRALYNGGVT